LAPPPESAICWSCEQALPAVKLFDGAWRAQLGGGRRLGTGRGTEFGPQPTPTDSTVRRYVEPKIGAASAVTAPRVRLAAIRTDRTLIGITCGYRSLVSQESNSYACDGAFETPGDDSENRVAIFGPYVAW
jgi:hypothetical protein